MNGTKTLRSLLLMISYFHFGFSMDKQPRKSAGLNPNAKPFHPQRQLIPNSPLSEPPRTHFNSNAIQPHQQIADDPIKLPDFLFDFEENEKPIILPDSLFPWEEKEQSLSSQGANLTPPEMGSNSQSIHITPPEIGSNNQGVHLTPMEIGQSENKQQDAHHFNRELIVDENPGETVQSKVDPFHHEEISTYLKHGMTTDAQVDNNKQNIDQLTKTIDQKHDITNYNRKLMTPIESKSASASKSGKVKHHHLKHQSQPSNRRDKKNRTDDSLSSNLTSHSSAFIQQQLASKTGEIITVKEIPPRNLDKAPEHVTPEIKMTKKDELNILEGQKVNEESRSIPLYQEQKLLEKEEKNEDNNDNEHKNQTKSGNNQQQEKKETSKKSKKKGKDKQKAVLSIAEPRNMKIKEKEDEELLQKEIENRRKEIEKQKLEEEQLKMKEKNEEKQQGKQKLDNVYPSSNMPLKKEVKGKQLISHPALSATPPINPTMASGSSGGSVVIPELASISPATIEAVAKSLSFLRKKEIERKEKLDKYKQIQKSLTKLQKKLDEIEKLEHSWLMEKIEQFTYDDKNWNSKENGEEEIQELKIEILKLTDANKSLGTEKGNIMELTEKKNKLTSLKNENLIKLKNSINRKKKKIDKHKPAIENFYKLAEELDQKEKELLEKQKYLTDIQKQIDELQKSLIYKFIKLNNNLEQEAEKIKEIQKQMEDPLKHLWIGYDAVLKILDQHWKTPEIEENSNDRKPYNFISLVFICTMPENKMNSAELSPFENTMKLALEKMLLHQNIYRVMNFKINVNGESISVYKKLNCFDELSKKMNMLAEKNKEIELSDNQDENIKLEFEHMKRIGKFFKEELNQKFREVLSFIIVGLDVLPYVWDQMVLNGIKQLSKWLPKNWKRQMDEIWIQLFIYYDMENSIVQLLSKDDNDKDAENVFDLPSDDDDDHFHELENEVDTINDLYGRIHSFGFSKEVENFMSEAFGKIKVFIQSIKMLVKIEKREKDAKLLPYLKSVYEKYWYMIYKDRIVPQLNNVLEYEFGREIDQKEREKIIKELLDKAQFERNPKVKEIFQQIALVNIDILVELMKVFDAIDKILVVIRIIDRVDKCENDRDFMDSIRKDNPNNGHYNSLWAELYGDDDGKKKK